MCSGADANGSLLVAYRYFAGSGKSHEHTYPVLVQHVTCEGFGEPRKLTRSGGSEEEAALVFSDGVAWIGWQQDQRLVQKGNPLANPPSGRVLLDLEKKRVLLSGQVEPSLIGIARVEAEDSLAGAIPMKPLQARSKVRDVPLDVEHPIILGTKRHEVISGDKVYRVYFGDLHRHSSVSRCSMGKEPRPRKRYAFGRDVCLYDFYALTDHDGQTSPGQWWRLGKLVDLYHSPAFCTLQGYEWGHSESGHLNVILRERLDQIFATRHISISGAETLWKMLPEGSALTIPHHSAHENFPSNWDVTDDRFVRLVEIFQARRGSFEFDGCLRQSRQATVLGRFVQDALSRGLKLGIIASTDHGLGASYAAVLAERLDRDSIFDALHARRTYGSTTKGILLDFRVNDHLMGEEVEVEGDPVLRWRVDALSEISEIAVFRNGEVVHQVGRTPRPLEKNEEVVLEIEMDDAPLARDLELTVSVDKGRFMSGIYALREIQRKEGEPGWVRLEKNSAVYKKSTTFNGRAPQIDRRLHMRIRDESVITAQAHGKSRSMPFSEMRRGNPLLSQSGQPFFLLNARPIEDSGLDLSKGIGSERHEAEWRDEDPLLGASWYYIRVVRCDGEMAWSSPVFVHRQ